jgi:hypothetical protein
MKGLILALASIGIVGSASAAPTTVTVNGKLVTFKGQQPRTVTGRLMVPMRGVFESIGAYVEYKEVLHRIVARRANETIEMRVGDKIANRNGTEIEMDVPPITVGKRAMIPLRFLAESLGATVNFDKAKNEVQIFTTEDLPGVKPPPPAK